MDNSSSGMIELSQVTTSRGQFPVLSRFTLTISQGQFINLYGPTGCGKTTVLRLICGLADPASGTVRVAGQDLSTHCPQGPGSGCAAVSVSSHGQHSLLKTKPCSRPSPPRPFSAVIPSGTP